MAPREALCGGAVVARGPGPPAHSLRSAHAPFRNPGSRRARALFLGARWLATAPRDLQVRQGKGRPDRSPPVLATCWNGEAGDLALPVAATRGYGRTRAQRPK